MPVQELAETRADAEAARGQLQEVSGKVGGLSAPMLSTKPFDHCINHLPDAS